MCEMIDPSYNDIKASLVFQVRFDNVAETLLKLKFLVHNKI